MTMQSEDRMRIEWACTRLIYDYVLRNDAADWHAVAAMFTEDGELARPSAPDVPLVGREAILSAFLARPPRTTLHICANVVVDALSETTAQAESAMLLFTSAGPPLVGSFHDRLVLTKAGWRFSSRRGSLDRFP